MQPLSTFYDQLNQPSKIVIVPHEKPDADALGACLAWMLLLKKIGHQVQVISPTNWASFLNFLPHAASIINSETHTATAKKYLKEADFFFAIDWNTWTRVRWMDAFCNSIKAQKILIDHHEHPDEKSFHFGISCPQSSSSSEMIFDIISEMGLQEKIDNAIATCLYAGIVDDTGSFRFTNTTAALHQKVAYLLTRDIAHTSIHGALFDINTPDKLQFIGHLLSNQMQVEYENRVALMWITQADIQKYHIKTGDTQGLVNYPMSMNKVQLVALMTDRTEEIRISLRSKTASFDVNKLARKYFGGGGHKMAAGGYMKNSLEYAITHFWAVMDKEKKHLI